VPRAPAAARGRCQPRGPVRGRSTRPGSFRGEDRRSRRGSRPPPRAGRSCVRTTRRAAPETASRGSGMRAASGAPRSPSRAAIVCAIASRVQPARTTSRGEDITGIAAASPWSLRRRRSPGRAPAGPQHCRVLVFRLAREDVDIRRRPQGRHGTADGSAPRKNCCHSGRELLAPPTAST
jgi:hypothetical protein